MTMKLKKFHSYKHLRKKTKVERAINLANTIPLYTDPLRHLYIHHSPNQSDDDERLYNLVRQIESFLQ